MSVLAGLALFLLLGAAARPAFAAAGDVVLMPDRDALMGSSIVVWGNTTHLNTDPFSLDFGDSSPVLAGVVGDQSYIATNHTYTAPGNYTVSLTIGGDTGTALVHVFDSGALNAENLRSIGINMAIEDGLRFLYVAQDNRAATFGTNKTSWTATRGFPS
ncbi:MAG: hypothetical protein LAO77_23980, partial [Acidobacteriia bacterium]|nr:hypothetical protein [Terriglobia bacterium]